MTHLMSILRVNDRFPQLKPATQLLRRAIDRSSPSAAGEGTFHFREASILPQDEKIYARSFRKRQLEVAISRKAHEHITNDGRPRVPIKKLARLRLPIGFRFDELMRRRYRAARESKQQCSHGPAGRWPIAYSAVATTLHDVTPTGVGVICFGTSERRGDNATNRCA